MKLPCPICKAAATHEVQWPETGEFRVYCEKDARMIVSTSTFEAKLRRLGGDS